MEIGGSRDPGFCFRWDYQWLVRGRGFVLCASLSACLFVRLHVCLSRRSLLSARASPDRRTDRQTDRRMSRQTNASSRIHARFLHLAILSFFCCAMPTYVRASTFTLPSFPLLFQECFGHCLGNLLASLLQVHILAMLCCACA